MSVEIIDRENILFYNYIFLSQGSQVYGKTKPHFFVWRRKYNIFIVFFQFHYVVRLLADILIQMTFPTAWYDKKVYVLVQTVFFSWNIKSQIPEYRDNLKSFFLCSLYSTIYACGVANVHDMFLCASPESRQLVPAIPFLDPEESNECPNFITELWKPNRHHSNELLHFLRSVENLASASCCGILLGLWRESRLSALQKNLQPL